MNFFQAQDAARHKTALLIVLLVLAVLCLIGLTQLLVMAVLHYGSAPTSQLAQGSLWSGFSWLMLACIAAGIISVVSLASVYKIVQLRAGGSAIAELLDGHTLGRGAGNLSEQKILNIVEEMAIASGMPVPAVYIIEEPAINAFAAGHDSKDVVIGVTRGCIERLNRDELQGVIAHEFSHIFNGDMRLNLKLIGILHGILFIGLLGRMLLEGGGSRRAGGRDDMRTVIVLFFLGVGLTIIGYSGVFFGNLIKAAISRQREFLADASAVQYTRNPIGIGGALKKIGGFPRGSRLLHPNAQQISHLFFSDGIGASSWMFSTHPSLARRIKAIDPHWKGDYPHVDALAVDKEISASEDVLPKADIPYTPHQVAAVITGAALTQAINGIGAPSAEHLLQARMVLTSLPDDIRQLSYKTQGAAALIHCLLLDKNPEKHQQQMVLLKGLIDQGIYSICEKVSAGIAHLPVNLRLPLLDMCLPTLKTLDAAQLQQFMRVVMSQIKADTHISLFEWALYRLLCQHLVGRRQHGVGKVPLSALGSACCTVLSALALATNNDPEHARKQFAQGWKMLTLSAAEIELTALDNMAKLDQAVQALKKIQPLMKPRLLKACCAVIENNNCYGEESIELLRAIADTIEAPIPPVITAPRI